MTNKHHPNVTKYKDLALHTDSTQNTNTQQKDISLINGAGFVHFLVAQLKVDVGVPGLLIRLPLHPALKHLPAARHVPQHLLHVGVLVPFTGRKGQ